LQHLILAGQPVELADFEFAGSGRGFAFANDLFGLNSLWTCIGFAAGNPVGAFAESGTGASRTIEAALRGVTYLGTVVAGAWPGSYPAGLDLGAEAHFNRPTIVFSRACSEPNPEYPNWDENRLFSVVWRLLCDGSLKSEPVVQPVVPFADLLEAYPKIATAPEENVKLGVSF